MIPKRVFADTGALLAMIVFPGNRSGSITLAGEVVALHATGAFELVIGQAVVDELDEVLDERFPDHRARAVTLLMPFTGKLGRRPTLAEIDSVLPFCRDPSDAPIFASAVIAKPEVVLSNDFQAFHTPEAKVFWERQCIRIESLYGLLCMLGRRQRVGSS